MFFLLPPFSILVGLLLIKKPIIVCYSGIIFPKVSFAIIVSIETSGIKDKGTFIYCLKKENGFLFCCGVEKVNNRK